MCIVPNGAAFWAFVFHVLLTVMLQHIWVVEEAVTCLLDPSVANWTLHPFDTGWMHIEVFAYDAFTPHRCVIDCCSLVVARWVFNTGGWLRTIVIGKRVTLIIDGLGGSSWCWRVLGISWRCRAVGCTCLRSFSGRTILFVQHNLLAMWQLLSNILLDLDATTQLLQWDIQVDDKCRSDSF